MAKTTEQFIAEASALHKNKYQYTKTKYVNSKTKVTITCPDHGDFEQAAGSHLMKRGCPKCARNINLTTPEFIERARQVHGDRYIYDKTVYMNQTTKLVITCPVHGDFEQLPNGHLRGQCTRCARDASNKAKNLTQEEFLSRCFDAHGTRYDYSKMVYTGIFNDILVICQEHGEFTQVASNHIRKKGCPDCGKKSGKKLTTEKFIAKSKEQHNERYIYNNTIYVDAHTKVVITCREHGDFEQLPYSHYKGGQGCPVCGVKYGKKEKEWLDSLNLNLKRQHKISINGRNFFVDGYDPSTNTVYEFYGDFWHGNLNIYNLNDINTYTKTTYGELYNKTIERAGLLKEAGYNVVEMWESDWKD